MVFRTIDEYDLAIRCYVKKNKPVPDFRKDLSWVWFNIEGVDNLIELFKQKRGE